MIVENLRHFYTKESDNFKAHELYDSGKFEPEEKLIFGPMLEFSEALREAWKAPLFINSGVRTMAKQRYLKRLGYKAATYSPHVYRCALDFDTDMRDETIVLVRTIREVAIKTKIPVRIGWKSYLEAGQYFVHVDTAPMIAKAAFCEGLITEWVKDAWDQPGIEW